ncbi:MAG: hypothetical protein A2W31_15635, partial [Planctomycetes bacterium RBG_16_64_10]
TQIYVGDEAEPTSSNLTLFRGGVVYDFLATPTQIVVFKPSPSGGGRFILLDPSRQLRSEIRTEAIEGFLTELQAWAASQEDPLLQFAAHPEFREHFEPSRGSLRLDSDWMQYDLLTTAARDQETMAAYREFSDWYGRLNSVTHVGSTPPFPRLAVNAALCRHARLPQRVELVIPARRPFRTKDLVMRAEHQISWRLSRQDQQRIDEVDRQLIQYSKVPYEEFRQSD